MKRIAALITAVILTLGMSSALASSPFGGEWTLKDKDSANKMQIFFVDDQGFRFICEGVNPLTTANGYIKAQAKFTSPTEAVMTEVIDPAGTIDGGFAMSFKLSKGKLIVTTEGERGYYGGMSFSFDGKYTKRKLTSADKKLVGSWHSRPYVDSGYGGRYVFYSDWSYEYNSGDDGDEYESGSWALSGNKLYLEVKNAGDVKKTIVLGKQQKTVKKDETPYPTKRTFDKQTFYRYSDKTDYWDDMCPSDDILADIAQ